MNLSADPKHTVGTSLLAPILLNGRSPLVENACEVARLLQDSVGHRTKGEIGGSLRLHIQKLIIFDQLFVVVLSCDSSSNCSRSSSFEIGPEQQKFAA